MNAATRFACALLAMGLLPPALFGCAKPRRYDLSPGAKVAIAESPFLQRELAETVRQAVAGLKIDVLAGEPVAVRVAMIGDEDAAAAVEQLVEEELRRKGARAASVDEEAQAARLDILVEEWGADLARDGAIRTRQTLVFRVALRISIHAPGLAAIEDRSAATRRVDYAAGWFGCDKLVAPVIES